MGQYATAYTCVGVELTIQELRAWLTLNKPKYTDSDYGTTPADEVGLLSEWAHYCSVNKSKPSVFASFDYDEDEYSGIYFGCMLSWSSISANTEDGCNSDDSKLSAMSKKISKIQAIYPKKPIRVITLQSIG